MITRHAFWIGGSSPTCCSRILEDLDMEVSAIITVVVGITSIDDEIQNVVRRQGEYLVKIRAEIHRSKSTTPVDHCGKCYPACHCLQH